MRVREAQDFGGGPGRRDISQALHRLSETELLRLRALARMRARGLPSGIAWSDLLHETILRALSGARPWPAGVPLLAFLAGVMRSVCSEHWRRLQRERQIFLPAEEREGGAETVPTDGSAACDPEQALAAAEAIAALYRLFADDGDILKILAGLAEGLTAAEIRRQYGWSQTAYDSARKRLRRAVLRHGLNHLGDLRR